MALDNKELYREFGAWIREERERQELLQKDVADMVEITQTYYSLIERGERSINLSLVLNICKALRLNFNKFLQLHNKNRKQHEK